MKSKDVAEHFNLNIILLGEEIHLGTIITGVDRKKYSNSNSISKKPYIRKFDIKEIMIKL